MARSDPEDAFERQIEAIAALKDPVRRALYLYVVHAGGDVSRDEAAEATRISRNLAAFHLDKLLEEGLLEATFRRLSGRSGPGAGRPAKLYRRSHRHLQLSLPARNYELVAHLFAQALSGTDSRTPLERLHDEARALGTTLAQAHGPTGGDSASLQSDLSKTVELLADHGFEPSQIDDAIVLRNCPFHALVDDHRDLVCGMNEALIDGLLKGLDASGIEARLNPQPGHCCVTIQPRAPR